MPRLGVIEDTIQTMGVISPPSSLRDGFHKRGKYILYIAYIYPVFHPTSMHSGQIPASL
jgi:hypothetical protein